MYKENDPGDPETGGGSERVEKEDPSYSLYEEIAINCYRYLGLTTPDQVDALTIPDYKIMMEAYDLRAIDEQEKIHQMAFATLRVKEKNKSGNKYKYRRFEDFFDKEKMEKETLIKHGRIKEKFGGLKNLLRSKQNKEK